MKSFTASLRERRCAFWDKLGFMKHRCPICKKETDSAVHADFPFCSERCRLLDLGAWASEKYVVSAPIFDEEDLSDTGRDSRTRQKTQDDTVH